MSNQAERISLAEAIAQAGQGQPDRPLNMVFEPADRTMLLNHFAGQALMATVTPGRLSPFTGFGAANADECVRVANELILAIERFHTLAVNRAQGHG